MSFKKIKQLILGNFVILSPRHVGYYHIYSNLSESVYIEDTSFFFCLFVFCHKIIFLSLKHAKNFKRKTKLWNLQNIIFPNFIYFSHCFKLLFTVHIALTNALFYRSKDMDTKITGSPKQRILYMIPGQQIYIQLILIHKVTFPNFFNFRIYSTYIWF